MRRAATVLFDHSVRTDAASHPCGQSSNSRRTLDGLRLLLTRARQRRVVALQVRSSMETAGRPMRKSICGSARTRAQPFARQRPRCCSRRPASILGSSRLSPRVSRCRTRVRQSAARELAAEANGSAMASLGLVDQTPFSDSIARRLADSAGAALRPHDEQDNRECQQLSLHRGSRYNLSRAVIDRDSTVHKELREASPATEQNDDMRD